jgi:redox-sensitive bicupin YhaK (pirin superfamily)
MIIPRYAKDRGHLNFGWLDAKHTFSFGSYFDPAHMGFRSLRVINNDLVQAGMGFDTHPHKDMEIITYILEGELEHRDTVGNHAVIKPGEIQIMSAGRGIFHSEFNPSLTNSTKLYQIWIIPNQFGIKPRYEQYNFLNRIKQNEFIDLANPHGGDQVAKIYQDASLKYGKFSKGFEVELNLDQTRGYWIQMLVGNCHIGELQISSEDGIRIENEDHIHLSFSSHSEMLLFELK